MRSNIPGILNIFYLDERSNRAETIDVQPQSQNIDSYIIWQREINQNNRIEGIWKGLQKIIKWTRGTLHQSVAITGDDHVFMRSGGCKNYLSLISVQQYKKTACSVICLAILCLLLASCSSTKNSYYFKTLPMDTTLAVSIVPDEATIRLNDQLSINISSLNPVEDAVYNAAAGGGGMGVSGSGQSAGGGGYLVDQSGNIQLHRLGNIHVAGMSRKDLKDKIEKDLLPYLKDPIVTVRYNNHRVTILGEVGSRVVAMPEDKLTIIDLIAGSGDLTQTARRDNILIIRETKTGKQFKRINLEDHSVFNTEWYYMQPNDIVYIEPNKNRIIDEKRARFQQNLSIAVSVVSLALIVITQLVRR